jgi:hypothetical protein
MSIYIGKLEFEGCFNGLDQIENDPGLYALLTRDGDDYQIVEMGECDGVHDCVVERVSGELSSALEGHAFELAVYYTDDLPTFNRRQLLEEIQSEFAGAEETVVVPGGNVVAFSR